jgi:hypothetical protein
MKLDFNHERAKSISTLIVIFICDSLKYSVVAIIGIIVIRRNY